MQDCLSMDPPPQIQSTTLEWAGSEMSARAEAFLKASGTRLVRVGAIRLGPHAPISHGASFAAAIVHGIFIKGWELSSKPPDMTLESRFSNSRFIVVVMPQLRLQTLMDVVTVLSVYEIISATIILSLVYQFTIYIYNIWFHPLARFPGPILRAASTLPDQYTKCMGRQLPDELELHKRYGSVVRMSPGALSFINPGTWKDIYTHKANRRQLKKDPKFYGLQGFGGNVMDDDARHAREKRLLLRGFASESLREQEPLYTKYFGLFVSQLQKECEGPRKGVVDMHEWFSFVAFDVIGELMFAESFHCLEKGETHYFIHNIYRSIQFALVQQMGRRYPWFDYVLSFMFWATPRFTQARQRHHKFTTDRVERRLAMGEARKDFISHVAFPGGQDKPLTKAQIVMICNTIVVAGSETITTLLSGCLYFLTKNPRVYQKLKDEVRGAFKSASEMDMYSTNQLPYLHAVLEEALRCYPPVPNRNPRVTGPQGDVVDGHYVPPNFVVATAGYVANHLECNFHKPNEFVPERWLKDADRPAEFANDNLTTSQAFSFGPRSCMGQSLAWVEMHGILARFVWFFDCEMLPETDLWKERQKTYIIWNKLPLLMRLTKTGLQ